MLKELKEEVGQRFRDFRNDKKKAQHLLAAELKVHQSTITNIEHGTTFPKINYLQYFFEKYGLNINWLVTGDGEMYMKGHPTSTGASQIFNPQIQYGDPRYDQYLELQNLMHIPVIEQVILAKLMECKTLFRDEVREYLAQQERETKEKVKRAAKAKVQK